MGITFFKTPAHRVFNYTPRYYDEKKDKMKERFIKYGKDPESMDAPYTTEAPKDEANTKENGGQHTYVPGASIRGSFNRKYNVGDGRKQAGNGKVKKIIMLITLAGAVVIALYLSQGLSYILKSIVN